MDKIVTKKKKSNKICNSIKLYGLTVCLYERK